MEPRRVDANTETSKHCLINWTDMQRHSVSTSWRDCSTPLHQSFHHILVLTQESMEKSKSFYRFSEVQQKGAEEIENQCTNKTQEGMEPTAAASHELYMGEICPHTSVHSSLSSMSLLRWKTIFLERDSSSSGAISGSSSHCKSKTFS